MRKFLRTLFFLASLSPVAFSLAYLNYEKKWLRPEIFPISNYWNCWKLNTTTNNKCIKKTRRKFPITVKKIESNDFIFIGFLLSYISPLVLNGFELSIEKIFLFIIIIGLILWFTSDIPTHPLLRVLSFKFYKIESSKGVVYILITKNRIKSPEEIKIVHKISESMLLDAGV